MVICSVIQGERPLLASVLIVGSVVMGGSLQGHVCYSQLPLEGGDGLEMWLEQQQDEEEVGFRLCERP